VNAPHEPARNRKRGTVTGAIFAGGASTRMGQSKQDMVLPDGTPMVARVHEAVAAVCDRVVLVGDSVHLRELERIADLRPGCGPLGGIEALLASGYADEYLIVPCDLPMVTAEVLGALLIETTKSATVFEDRPLPARVSVGVLPPVRLMLDEGRRAVWPLLDQIDAERIALRVGWAALLRNANTPADVARIER
jgi:molybdenum cofactor guanylyltransferase